MPAYYRASLNRFVNESASSIIGLLTVANGKAKFPLSPEAAQAWNLQLDPLIRGANEVLARLPQASYWEILLEYPARFVGKRIDAVLLAGNLIIVIEIKTGKLPTSAIRQVEDYCLYLACFHEDSRGRRIVPMVISDARVHGLLPKTTFDRLVSPCHVARSSDVGRTLEEIYLSAGHREGKCIDPGGWDSARFRPIPPIIDAAVSLYEGKDIFEIDHACAAKEALNDATSAIVRLVDLARSESRKIICFVTGVPGAGKTLVGLNAVHHTGIRREASFLSGNGPLVKVIKEALIRDVVRRRHQERAPVTRREAEIDVQAFIHNVHRFADEYYGQDALELAQHVIVFDEAQRAWDAEQNERADRRAVSEAAMMLEVMDRHKDWAVIVALIGGGQEINRGEAGISEWGRALGAFANWQIYASPEVLRQDDAVPGFQLFDRPTETCSRVKRITAFHLDISIRSIRAKRISEWVNAVLRGDADNAARIIAENEEPPVLTRSLHTAKNWLSERRTGTTRSGLVASATAARLRVDGLEISFDFHRSFEWEHWFLDDHDCVKPGCDHQYCHDVRSSSTLEVAATQFEIQGLELDWVGVCWGEDLIWKEVGWQPYRFNNKQWRLVKNMRKATYLQNAYRVLLTRARQGIIIYVPSPGKVDETRLVDGLDATADFLRRCGAKLLVDRSCP